MTNENAGEYTRDEWMALTPDEQDRERSRILFAVIFAPISEGDDDFEEC